MLKLNKGDKVAIVAPSGQIGSDEKIKDGLKYLKKLGLCPILGKHTLSKYRYMAGSDKERAEDINNAFLNPEIKAIFCVRAAAGATRILPFINYSQIKKNPKPLIGFCDNAALMLALNKKANIISWNGFLLTYDFKDKKLDPLIQNHIENLLNGKKYIINSGHTIKKGTTKGQLICCNLSVLLRLAGTPYFPNLKNKILLIEDVHERLHKIDLMLQQLKQLPNFNKISGIILGQFTDIDSDEEDGSLNDSIEDFVKDLDIPIIKDFCFGHTKSRCVLPLGGTVKFSATKCSLEITGN